MRLVLLLVAWSLAPLGAAAAVPRFVSEGCEADPSYELAVEASENGVPRSLEQPRISRAAAAPAPGVVARHRLRILVFDPQGQPVTAGTPRVEALPPHPRGLAHARNSVQTVEPGDWWCSVRPDTAYSVVWFDGEHALAEEVVRVPKGTEVLEVELHLAAPQVLASLAVTVRDSAGERVATQDSEKVRVAVRTPRGDQVLVDARRSTPLAPFRFELPAGEYVVETSTIAEEQGLWSCYEPPVYLGYGAVRTPVLLRAGECTELSTTPWRAGRLHVTVLLPEGFEGWGAEVLEGDTWLEWMSNMRVEEVQGDSAPREFSFLLFEPDFEWPEREGRPHSIAFRTHDPLRPGDYRVAFEAPGCLRAELVIRVGPGEDTPVRVALATDPSARQ